MRTPSDRLPLRVAERMGRLCHWAMGLDLSRREREIVLHLIADGGKHLDSWASHASIGAALGVSARVAGEAIRDLAERGLVVRQPRTHPDGTRTSDRIRLVPPPELAEVRQNETELADGAEYDYDYAHRLDSGTHETCEPMNIGTHERCEDPSSTYRGLDREEGSSHETCEPAVARPRRRMPSRFDSLATAILQAQP